MDLSDLLTRLTDIHLRNSQFWQYKPLSGDMIRCLDNYKNVEMTQSFISCCLKVRMLSLLEKEQIFSCK